jgi:hypothetical protein
MTYIYTRETTSSIAHALTNDSYASWHANYAACEALAEYLEGLAEDIGEPIELDTVAIRCDFAMYPEDEYADLASEYDRAPQAGDYEDEDEFKEALLDWLRDETTVIEYGGGIIIQSL